MQSKLAALTGVLILMSSVAADGRGNGPERIPNKVPYRVSKPSAATGRAGSATLTARALLGKSGQTDVELTTGDLDTTPASAPGAITRAQVSTLDALGRRRAVKEYSTIDANAGYAAFSYTGLARGQALSIQATVTGIDGERTDVVSAEPRVKLRPDVVVDRVLTAPSVIAGTPVVITGVLGERNQDVGARAACVLSVDDVEVDRADGIWIDAAGTVSCAFTYAFQVAGSRSIVVRAADVVPSDYDSDNNAAATTILVRGEEPFDSASLQVLSDEHEYGGRYQSWSLRDDGGTTFGRDVEFETRTRQVNQIVSYFAVINSPITLPVTSVAATESTDGTVLRTTTIEEVVGPGCQTRIAGTEQLVFFYICTSGSGPEWGLMVMYQSAAGEVTYFSRGYDTSWHQSPDGTVSEDASYSWNESSTMPINFRFPNPSSSWGSTYTVDVTVVSADTVFRGPVTTALQHDSTGWTLPWTCSESTGDFGWTRVCQDYADTRVSVAGAAGTSR